MGRSSMAIQFSEGCLCTQSYTDEGQECKGVTRHRMSPAPTALLWSVSEIHGSSALPARLYHLAVYGVPTLTDDSMMARSALA